MRIPTLRCCFILTVLLCLCYGLSASGAEPAESADLTPSTTSTSNCQAPPSTLTPIDRKALVARHAITDTSDFEIPLGNGEFCFNVDATGLQTLHGNTLAHWGWHSFPLPAGVAPEAIPETGTLQQGRNRPGHGDESYPNRSLPIPAWMFDNAHMANLARVRLVRKDGRPIAFNDLKQLKRRYDLWTGLHRSEFLLDGEPVMVETLVEMTTDALIACCQSPLFSDGRLRLEVDFPYPTLKTASWAGDFTKTTAHATHVTFPLQTTNAALMARDVDDLHYRVQVLSSLPLNAQDASTAHRLTVGTTADSDVRFLRLQFQLTDPTDPRQEVLDYRAAIPAPAEVTTQKTATLDEVAFREIQTAVAMGWEHFWRSGAAIDLSESKDPRWFELERKVVLSQYLLRANSAGSWPPAEAGLMGIDPWRSQFHCEMIYWHLACSFLWNHPELTEPALRCYTKLLPISKRLATQLNYAGAMWPKSTSFNGRTAPWMGNLVLLWKQPHPILLAELDYRARPTRQTLEKWAEVIEQTALFMAYYPIPDEAGQYHLDPVMPPSETGVTRDTVFDLAYWRWGLNAANRWRERLGQPRIAEWDALCQHLAPLPTKQLEDGTRVFVHAGANGWDTTYDVRNWEHPDVVGVFGMLPPVDGVNPEIARASVRKCAQTWQWQRAWGWDFPWIAMAAAKTNQPDLAVDMLCHSSPRNASDQRGVNTNHSCPYLPGNGGTLYAVALMAAGWDGAPEVDRAAGEAPGFPRNGQWVVRQEGFLLAP